MSFVARSFGALATIMVAWCFQCAPTSAANIAPYGDGNPAMISIEGEITQGDLERLNAIYRYSFTPPQRSSLIIDLDSPGGDLTEAMSIGRWIRKTKATTGLKLPESCASACVYIFAAGVNKFLGGPLLIHRPYLMTRPNGSIDAAMKAALSASRTYFAEMNIPEDLADVMFSIAPDDARPMTAAEIQQYRLNSEDMAEAEERILNNAEGLSITRLEYMRRLHEYQQSPELAYCLTLNDKILISCAKGVGEKYGIVPEATDDWVDYPRAPASPTDDRVTIPSPAAAPTGPHFTVVSRPPAQPQNGISKQTP